MVFTSFHFAVFFFVTIILGHLLKNRKQQVFLLLASYYFYSVLEPWYLIIMLFSSNWDYFAALGIEANDRRDKGLPPIRGAFLGAIGRKTWLIGSMIVNLSLLAYFKYTNFGIEVFNDLQPYGSTLLAWPATNILLPVGISFYTFMSLSYTVDVYRGLVPARRNLLDFALYVAFFPHLVAGPIVRSTTFFSRLDDRLPIRRDDIIIGVTRIVVGFFRKLVLSDNLAAMTVSVYGNPAIYNPLDIWLASFAFAFQIYLDFAGYTDIARGVARLFGWEFEVNFLYPFSSRNVTDHWSRWHISFTTWIRDYIFIPLGGSRQGNFRTYINIFITWLFGGIWHGAAYHYIFWGLWQGTMISVHRMYSRTKFHETIHEKGGIAYSIFARVFTMFWMNFGFIWFRAETMTKATLMQGRLFGINDLPAAFHAFISWAFRGAPFEPVKAAFFSPTPYPSSAYSEYLILIALYFTYEYVFNYLRLEYFWKPENKGKLIVMLIVMIFCVMVFATPETPNFLYFQF